MAKESELFVFEVRFGFEPFTQDGLDPRISAPQRDGFDSTIVGFEARIYSLQFAVKAAELVPRVVEADKTRLGQIKDETHVLIIPCREREKVMPKFIIVPDQTIGPYAVVAVQLRNRMGVEAQAVIFEGYHRACRAFSQKIGPFHKNLCLRARIPGVFPDSYGLKSDNKKKAKLSDPF